MLINHIQLKSVEKEGMPEGYGMTIFPNLDMVQQPRIEMFLDPVNK